MTSKNQKTKSNGDYKHLHLNMNQTLQDLERETTNRTDWQVRDEIEQNLESQDQLGLDWLLEPVWKWHPKVQNTSENKILNTKTLVIGTRKAANVWIEAHKKSTQDCQVESIIGAIFHGDNKSKKKDLLWMPTIQLSSVALIQCFENIDENCSVDTVWIQCPKMDQCYSFLQWTKLVFSKINSEKVIVLDEFPTHNYKTEQPWENYQPPFLNYLATSAAPKLPFKCPLYEAPNMSTHLSASIMSHCESRHLSAYLFLTALESIYGRVHYSTSSIQAFDVLMPMFSSSLQQLNLNSLELVPKYQRLLTDETESSSTLNMYL